MESVLDAQLENILKFQLLYIYIYLKVNKNEMGIKNGCLFRKGSLSTRGIFRFLRI